MAGDQQSGRYLTANYNDPVYSPQLLDHFQNPRNAGDVPDPDTFAQTENPVCGDILKLSLKLQGDRIAEIRFRAKGCVPAMACGSAVTELVKGKTIAQAGELSREDLLHEVGGVPEASNHAIHLAIDTLRSALAKLQS
jgi:nitrogen fixation NifU-like protein